MKYLTPSLRVITLLEADGILQSLSGSKATNGLDNAPENGGTYTGDEGVSVGAKSSTVDWETW